MRFHNLTITMTLACLSIVAIAALALLPITDGICEWTGDDSYKSYSKTELDFEEQGWSLSASLSASGHSASGSVSPSIHTVGVFTSATTYSGSANVRAWRSAGHRYELVYCGYPCDYCQGHQQAVAFEATEDPENKTIFAKVDMVKMTRVYGKSRTQIWRRGDSTTANTVVSVADYASVTVGGEKFSWTQDGVEYWEERTEEVPDQPSLGDAEGAEAGVDNYPNGDSGAEASFDFENPGDDQGSSTDIGDSNSVSYSGIPLQPILP